MALTIDEANQVASLTQTILSNVDKGLPPHTGIEVADIKRAIELMRKDTAAAQTKSKASGVSNIGSGGGTPAKLDIAALFANAPSKK